MGISVSNPVDSFKYGKKYPKINVLTVLVL